MKYSTIEVTGDVKIGSGGKTYEGEYVVTPSTAEQVLETAGFTLANDVVVEAIPSEYVDTSDANATANDILSNKTAYVDGEKITGEIPVRYSSDVTVSGADVTLTKGYYGNNITKTIPSGSISNLTFFDDFSQEPNTVHVSVDYTVNGGYMEGGRYIRGNHVITASQLVSGTQNITQNGTTDITNYKYVNVNVPNPSTGSISITSNNTYDVTNYASAVVNVPQGITPTGTISITHNGTYDVTNYASAYANIPSPSGTRVITANGTYDVTNYASADVDVPSGISVDDLAQNLQPSGAITLSDSVTQIGDYAFAGKPITSVYGKNVTSIGEHAFINSAITSITDSDFPNLGVDTQWIVQLRLSDTCTSIKLSGTRIALSSGYSALRGCKGLVTAEFPNAGLNTGNSNKSAGTFCLGDCTNLEMADLGFVNYINNNCFYGSSKLATIVLRNTSLVSLGGVGAFNNTPFKSGGTGGTIYIPKVLYDHLGDNSADDYQHATNWSTVHGYGTITWAKIEGSIYE